MEALKSKGRAGPVPVCSSEPSKRSKLDQVHPPPEEDETEIMALLDEIDCVYPQSAVTATATAIQPQLAATACSPPQPQLCASTKDGGSNGGQSSGLLSSDVEFGSEMGLEEEETLVGNREPAEMVISGPAAGPEGGDRPDQCGDFYQILPFPLAPESFTINDWRRNVAELSRRSLPGWQQRVALSALGGIPAGGKATALLLMVKESVAIGRELRMRLVDETGGEIGATVHERIFGRQSVRAHFGLAMLLRDTTVLSVAGDPLRQERHLVITPHNVVRIYSNVHQV